MNKAYERIVWENYPSEKTPLNETNLNKIDAALNIVDNRVVNFDTTKANQTDLLQSLKTVTYNEQTGLFTFTWWNGTTKEVDLNIEKIPLSFSMSKDGIITMVNTDGTESTANVAELIKLYSFVASTDIRFNTETDKDGNKTITAFIVDGSITEEKLRPNFLADCQNAKNGAETAATNSLGYANDSRDFSQDAEAWAVGKRGGKDVPETDETYHNSAEYWAKKAEESTSSLEVSGSYYAISTGQAAKQAKTATVDVSQGFKLRVGVIVGIKFDANNTYNVTAGNPITLNVNDTGAKPIYYAATSENTGTNTTVYGRANSINYYQYDGVNWVWISGGRDNNTTYNAMSVSELATGTATAARTVRADYLKQGIKTIAGLIDTKNNTTTFTSSDVADSEATAWDNVTKLETGEKHSSIFAKMSQMFKNIRFLYNNKIDLSKILTTVEQCVASTDNTNIASAAVINELNSNLNIKIGEEMNYTVPAGSPGWYYPEITVFINVPDGYILIGTLNIPHTYRIGAIQSRRTSLNSIQMSYYLVATLPEDSKISFRPIFAKVNS